MRKYDMDKLNKKVSRERQSGEFKRPDHFDFKDSNELKKEEWSGIRKNSLNDYIEVWVLGEKKKDISPQMLTLNPRALQDAMQELFGLGTVEYEGTPIVDNKKSPIILP
jgi:hypothetical protein